MLARLTPLWTAAVVILLVLAVALLAALSRPVPTPLWTLTIAALVAHYALQTTSSGLANGLVVLSTLVCVVVLLAVGDVVPAELWSIAVGAVGGHLALTVPGSSSTVVTTSPAVTVSVAPVIQPSDLTAPPANAVGSLPGS